MPRARTRAAAVRARAPRAARIVLGARRVLSDSGWRVRTLHETFLATSRRALDGQTAAHAKVLYLYHSAKQKAGMLHARAHALSRGHA